METILKTENLTKTYGKNTVVKNVNMTINKGDIYGFIGMNGAGKSTLMKMVCGLAAPTRGDFTLFGSKDVVKARRRIGSTIEQPALFPNMSARDNLLYYNKILGIAGTKNIDEVLDLVDLQDTGRKKTKQFSLGMKQRLAIAIALLGSPDFLILDEPINGLDPSGIMEVRELILKLNEENNITILISSHILGELSKIATTYGVISEGNLVEQFTREELEERCKHCLKLKVDNVKEAAVVLEQKTGTHEFKVFDGTTICIYDNIHEGMAINTELVKAGIGVSHLALEGQDLEGYFIDLMGGMK